MASIFGHFSYQMLDNLGVTVSAPIYFTADDTKTIAQLVGDAQAAGTQMDAVSDSAIQKVTIELTAPNLTGTWKASPATTAENERTGLFNFSQAASPYKYGVDVPAIAESLIVNGKINLAATSVVNFINFLTTAGTVVTYVSTAIKALLALIDALLSFRKHRKPETRRSSEVG